MQQLIKQIEQWAEERNLIEGSTPQKQMLKLMEEFGELCGGIAKNKPEVIKDSIGDCLVVMIILKEQLAVSSFDLAELGKNFSLSKQYPIELCCLDFGVHYGVFAKKIGKMNTDIVAPHDDFDLIRCYGSLLAICHTLKLNVKDCLRYAYNQIKDRKGKMREGIWVKEEDL